MQAAQDHELATNDLGPLAWVLDELRKSLESASSALRRFVRDAAQARGQDMTSVDAGQLRRHGRVDRDDAGVRQVRAQNLGAERARDFEVRRVTQFA